MTPPTIEYTEIVCQFDGWKPGLIIVIADQTCWIVLGGATQRAENDSRKAYMLTDEERRYLVVPGLGGRQVTPAFGEPVDDDVDLNQERSNRFAIPVATFCW